MTVRVLRTVHPRPSDRTASEPYEQVHHFERVYRHGDLLICVGPQNNAGLSTSDGDRYKALGSDSVVEIVFSELDLVPYAEMVEDLGSEPPADAQLNPSLVEAFR